MVKRKVDNDIVPIMQVMNANAYFGMGGLTSTEEKRENELDAFLQAIPAEVFIYIKEAVASGNKDRALKVACDYVVKFYQGATFETCISYGDFVYELIRRSIVTSN